MAALVDAAEEIRAPSVVYGAGLENQPALVARLAAGRRLLGCRPETLQRVRDPAVLVLPCARRGSPTRRRSAPPTRRGGPTARAAGCASRCAAAAAAACASGEAGRWRARSWCRSESRASHAPPRRSRTDGRGRARHQRAARRPPRARRARLCLVRQRRAAAAGRGAAARADRRGAGDLHASGGRLRAPRALRRRPRVGRRARVGRRGQPAPDRVARVRRGGARGRRLRRPRGGCAGRLPSIAPASAPPRAAGKAILFATGEVRVGDTRGWPARGIRDVPHPGERIEAGHPICTLVSVQDSPDAVMADLEARAAGLRTELALSSART